MFVDANYLMFSTFSIQFLNFRLFFANKIIKPKLDFQILLCCLRVVFFAGVGTVVEIL